MWRERKIHPDIDNVLKVASLLDTSEFNVFRLAHAKWYGDCPSIAAVERSFVAYMFADRVPVWVRDFTRRVLIKSLSEEVDPAEYGVQEPPVTPRLILIGRLYVAALLLGAGLLIYITLDYEDLLDVVRNCYFPPCY